TPGPDRVHGYYTLPILHDGHLLGRVDAKVHRGEGRLEVKHVHLEPWLTLRRRPAGRDVDPDGVLPGLAGAPQSPARFLNARAVVLARVTPGRLRAPLARRLRDTVPSAVAE